MAKAKTNLDRAQLLGKKATSVALVELDIPELGGVVYVKGSTGKERDFFERSLRTHDGELRGNIRARAAIACLCDENGKKLFADDDVAAVGAIRADILSRVFDAFQKVNGVSKADVEELGGVSDEPTAGSDSSSN